MPSFSSIKSTLSTRLSANRWWILLLFRIVFVGYFAYLTILLLTPDPFRCVGSSSGFLRLLHFLSPIAHILSFSVLTVLALVAFRPLPRWVTCASIAVYALSTEFLQMLFPPRTAEWQDGFQDLTGILVGLMLVWLFLTAWRWLKDADEETASELVV